MANGRTTKESQRDRERLDLFKRRVIVSLGAGIISLVVVIYLVVPVVAPVFGVTPGKPDPVVFTVLVAAGLVMLGLLSPGEALAFLQGFRVEITRRDKSKGTGKDDSEDGDGAGEAGD